MSSESLFQKEKPTMTVNFNNIFTINNYFNVPAPEAHKTAKNFSFNASNKENVKEKQFLKTKSQFFHESKPKILNFLKESKSNHELQLKNEETTKSIPKVTVEKGEQVQINEERNSYNDYKAEILGYLLLIMYFVFFLWFGMSILLRMLDIKTNNVFFDLAGEDLYYCMLFPLILPISVFAVYGNWVAMKFFRHS